MSTQATATPSSRDMGKQLCLLSLDGGGVRGLSTLLILKRLMEGVNPTNPPKPCQYFHMIGGTSTGGLIALMLGRIRLSVDDCIAAYTGLSPKIFTKLHHRVKLSNGESQGRFDHEALEQGIRALLKKYGFEEDALLKESLDAGTCKTFVCATSQQTGKPVVLSSYYNERRGSDMLNVAKIWEVARATSAATTFFEPITIDDETFVDGATGANNPVQYMWTEAGDIWGIQDRHLEDEVCCLVSIGTGIPSLQAFGPGFADIAKALKDIATDTEEEADLFQKHHTKLFQTSRAFRFNVKQGLEKIGLEEVEKWGEMKAATRKYIQTEEVHVQVKACALNLQEQEWLKVMRRSIMNLARPDIVALNDDDCHPSKTELQWLTHTKSFETWRKSDTGLLWYRSNPNAIDDSRGAVAASVAYRISNQGVSFAGPQFGVGSHLSTVLYFQCDRRQAMDDFYEDADPTVAPEKVLWSLICQSLLIGCIDTDSLNLRILELPSADQRAIIEGIGGTGSQSLPSLFGLLIRTLQLTETPQFLAIDNLHLINSSKVGTFVESLLLVGKRLSASGRKLPILISAAPLGGFQELLHDALWVDDNSEQCVQSLYFPEWNVRRNQVADAEEGTNKWIWDHPQYQRWCAASSSVLWVEGKPGSGKSVLAKSLQKRLGPSLGRASTGLSTSSAGGNAQRQRAAVVRSKVAQDCLTADWFYSTRGGATGRAHLSLLKSILYQLLEQNRSLFQFVAPFYRENACRSGPGQTSWDPHDITLILQQISKSGVSVACIVDAMDEAEPTVDESILKSHESRRTTILSVLSMLIFQVRGSGLKFIVLSRPDPLIEKEFLQIQRKLPATFKIILEHANQDDILLLIEMGLCSIREAIHAYDSDMEEDLSPRRRTKKYKGLKTVRKALSESEDTALQSIHSYLQEHARGVILWVTLVLGELEAIASGGMSTFSQLEERAKALPQKLDTFYEHIVQDLAMHSSEDDLSKARMTFLLVCGSVSFGSPIRLRELWEALAIPADTALALQSETDPIMSNRIRFNSWAGFRRQLRRKCGPLIDVVKSESRFPLDDIENDTDEDLDVGPDDVVQPMHRTVKDFLQSPKRQGPLHFSDKTAIDMVMGIAKRYIEIGFPVSTTKYYLPASANADGDWHKIVQEYVDHLENRILLQFALSVLSQKSPQLEGDLNILTWIDSLLRRSQELRESSSDGTQEHTDLYGIKGLIRKELKFYPRCDTRFSDEKVQLRDSRSVVLGEAIHHACANGLTIATQSLLELCLVPSSHSGNETYAIANGALVAAIERDLLQEVRILTRNQRHQSRLVNANIATWPVGRKGKNKQLDPFIGLAVRSGSVKIIDYMFDLTDRHYARTHAVHEFAVTSMAFESEKSDDYFEEVDVPDPSAQIDKLLPLVFVENDNDDSYPISDFRKTKEQSQTDGIHDILDLDKPRREPRRGESYESFESFGIVQRDLKRERKQEKREFIQLRAGCIFLTNQIHGDHTSVGDDQNGSANASFLEDVREALGIVMERLKPYDASIDNSRTIPSSELPFYDTSMVPADIVDSGSMQPDAFARFVERHVMSSARRKPNQSEPQEEDDRPWSAKFGAGKPKPKPESSRVSRPYTFLREPVLDDDFLLSRRESLDRLRDPSASGIFAGTAKSAQPREKTSMLRNVTALFRRRP